MVVISDILVQGIQMALVLLLAPLLTGFVRKIKAITKTAFLRIEEGRE